MSLVPRVRGTTIHLLTRAFHEERVDESGAVIRPRGVRRAFTRLNQELVERGRQPPWIDSREACLAYWRSRTATADTNRPEEYASKSLEIVDFVDDLWAPFVEPDARILELGCNAGPNLFRLQELGYSSLAGIEVNPHAVEELRRRFPALWRDARIIEGSLEERLPELADGSYDVVFSIAVLIHVHPTSAWIFPEIVRVARRHVCVVELETASNWYVFARNYRRVFERLGCEELASVVVEPVGAPSVSRGYDGYVARLFRVPERELDGS